MSDNIGVTLTPENIQLNPGESAEITIALQNSSNVVDVVSLEVVGLDPSWCKLSLVSSALFPADQAESVLTITPPKVSASLAKNYSFAIKVSSQKDPTQVTEQPATLDLLPFYAFDALVRPQKDTNPKGYFLVELSNSGNSDLNIQMSGSDQESLCRFLFDPQRPRLGPGENTGVELVVEPAKRPLKGRPRTYSLTLSATPDPETAEPKTIPAQLDATARLPNFMGNAVAFMFRRRRNPRAYLRVSSRPEQALDQATDAPAPARGFPKWLLWAGAAVLVLAVAAIIIAFLVLRGGGASFQADFLLDPGEDVTFAFPLPEAVPTRVHAKAEWQGTADSLEVIFLRPDGSQSKPVQISPQAPSVTFRLDQAAVQQGLTGWRLNLKNNTDSGQADGKLSLTISELK
ncbi:MAG: hypothetical protein IIB31_06440 [Chloroflexi bacterium]|nr:hypothetical protein [Chloroflexota bacterium]